MSLDIDLYRDRLESYKVGTKDGQIDVMRSQVLKDFKSNPSYYEVLCGSHDDFKNNTEQNYSVIIQGHSNPTMKKTEKYLLFDINDNIESGFYIKHKERFYLITSYPDDSNIVYYKSKIMLCNSSLTYETSNQIIEGYDSMGRPIYSSDSSVIKEIKCYVNHKSGGLEDSNDGIILGENKIAVYVPYNAEPEIVRGFNFEMYGVSYEIKDINRTFVVNNQGVVELICEEVA